MFDVAVLMVTIAAIAVSVTITGVCVMLFIEGVVTLIEEYDVWRRRVGDLLRRRRLP